MINEINNRKYRKQLALAGQAQQKGNLALAYYAGFKKAAKSSNDKYVVYGLFILACAVYAFAVNMGAI